MYVMTCYRSERILLSYLKMFSKLRQYNFPLHIFASCEIAGGQGEERARVVGVKGLVRA